MPGVLDAAGALRHAATPVDIKIEQVQQIVAFVEKGPNVAGAGREFQSPAKILDRSLLLRKLPVRQRPQKVIGDA